MPRTSLCLALLLALGSLARAQQGTPRPLTPPNLPPAPTLPHAQELPRLAQRAEQGDPRAECAIGLIHLLGRGTKADPPRANEHFLNAALAGDAHAMSWVAFCHARGHGVPYDLQRAKTWALKGAKAGDPFAKARALAWAWEEGGDRLRAAPYYLKAARAGDLRGYLFVAQYLAEGVGFRRDASASARWHERGAKLGYPPCMWQHGLSLLYGPPSSRDERAGFRWIERSHRLGDHRGTLSLARAFWHGVGVEADLTRAVTLFREVVSTPRPPDVAAPAHYELGRAHEEGWGTSRDAGLARKHYRAAAQGEHAKSIFRLAELVRTGRGGAANREQALELYAAAANLGHARSMAWLGYALKEGWVEKRRPTLARKFLIRAAELGDNWSCAVVAFMLRRGEGGPVDVSEARRFLEAASKRGYGPASRELGDGHKDGWLGAVEPLLAERAYRDAIAQSTDVAAMRCLAEVLVRHLAGPAQIAEGLCWLSEADRRGDSVAPLLLGWFQEHGHYGLRRDQAAARRLYLRAKERGNPEADEYLRSLQPR